MGMTDFAHERPRLRAIAARLLGGSADVDDVLQEAWLRFAGAEDVDDLPAWLTTVVTRLCLDQLRKRRRFTDVVDADDVATAVDPESDVVLADTVGDAMQVVLDVLTPSERAAFVLHDVFGYPFGQVAAIMGRSDTAVRKLASRARRRVRGESGSSAIDVASAERRRVVDAFLTAARGGDLTSLLSLLAPDAVMRADLVGQRMGADAVYEGATAVAARFNGTRGATPVTIDGDLGAAWIHRGETKVAFVFHLDAGLVQEVELIADPDVLTTIDIIRHRATGDRES